MACHEKQPPIRFPITVEDDLLSGHFVFSGAAPAPPTSQHRCDVLVVGAGIAGLTAAHLLRNRDVMVCELGHVPGGSSAASAFNGQPFSLGAHYDLEYPANWGQEVLTLLADLGVVTFNSLRNMWEFVEKAFVIGEDQQEMCVSGAEIRDDVLPESEDTAQFEHWVHQFAGKMPLPSRLINPKLHFLNRISFAQYLQECGFHFGSEFLAALNYQLTDDYGAGQDKVSALAGIHYYQCRPYDSQSVELFSPPEGNAYFAEKLLESLPQETLHVNHAVTGIFPKTNGFQVDVLDLVNRCRKTVLCKKIIYAGQKLALRYIYPQDFHLFSHVAYAPWMVVNLLLEGPVTPAYWQNEILGHTPHFLGFVNSQAQNPDPTHTILTAYYCLPDRLRSELTHVRQKPELWMNATIQAIQTILGQTVRHRIAAASIKLHGHGMPIPKPDYLFRDANDSKSHRAIAYAGVDNARLPLLFEAIDSGIAAVHVLEKG